MSGNASIVRDLFLHAFNDGDFTVAEQHVVDDYVDHSLMAAPAPGREGFLKRIMGLRLAFPDIRMTIEHVVEDGDMVALTWRMEGTHTGPLGPLPPSGNPISVAGMNLERMDGDRIAEHWSFPDNLGLFVQVGAIEHPLKPRG
jgi:steroid delta-isomerase-like uncharacterized protein